MLPEQGRGSERAGRLIVTRAASEGDLGSAELNSRVAARARASLEAETSGLHDIAGHTVFIDVLEPPPQLVVFGAGDDARPLVRFAADVGFRVVVVDRRPRYLTPERFPAAAQLITSRGDRLADVLPLDPACYAVVMTHNFADDEAYVRTLVSSPVAYIGVLGPRQRTERLVRHVRGIGPPEDDRIYGPVGLDIGTDGAEQVGLAVIAEILAVRSGRRARSLRERAAPIHAPAD
jgi:xanthine/CO dehydrogenase XdhC/CoxF family maturation factor